MYWVPTIVVESPLCENVTPLNMEVLIPRVGMRAMVGNVVANQIATEWSGRD